MFTASLNLDGFQALVSGKDPVCGMAIEAAKAAGASSHEGKLYYFCAEACKQQFDADPAKYASKA